MFSLFKTFICMVTVVGVLATKSDVGFIVTVDVPNVTFSEDGGLIYITAPVHFTRVGSTASNLSITAYTSQFQTNLETDDDQIPTPIYNESFQVSQQTGEFDQPVYFNITPSDTFRDVALTISIASTDPDNGLGAVVADGAVIAYDLENNIYVARSIGEFAHEKTLELNLEMELENIEGEDETPGGDLGEDPERTADTNLDGTTKDGKSDPPTEPPVVPPSVASPPTTPNPHTSPSPGGAGGDIVWVTETVRRTTTICPTPTPPPPPCPEEESHVYARQVGPVTPAFVNARITYRDRNNAIQPLRYLRVTAVAMVFSASGDELQSRKSTARVNGDGQARFQFSIRAGQSIRVYRLNTLLDNKYYRIGGRKVETDALVTRNLGLRLTVNPWIANAGETKSFANRFPFSEYNSALWVDDAYYRLTQYASTKVTRGTELEKVNVWFPSTNPGTFFTERAGGFLNIPNDDAGDPDVLAHEYGHFFHYLARGKEFFDGGGDHVSCGEKYERKAGVSFSEGYATAFGLIALDGTILATPTYGAYQDLYPDGSVNFRNFEILDCNIRELRRQESRVGATLFDLADRLLDDVATVDSDNGRVSTPGFSREGMNVRFDPRFIFWTAINANPPNIEEYWYGFQSLVSPAWEGRAWNVFDYGYAEFPRIRG